MSHDALRGTVRATEESFGQAQRSSPRTFLNWLTGRATSLVVGAVSADDTSMDFPQACFEVHRHYILAAVGELLEDALMACGEDEVQLRCALPADVIEIVESARLHGGRFECSLGSMAPTRFTSGVRCIIGASNARHVRRVWSDKMLEREMALGHVAERSER